MTTSPLASPHGAERSRPRGRAPLAALSFLACIAASAWIVRRAGIDLAGVLSAIPAPAHAMCAALALFEVGARGARVRTVARGLGLGVSIRTSVRAQLAGDALGSVTPSRAGSDPAKLAVFARAGVPLGSGGALLVGEMGFEAIALVLISGVILLLADGLRWVSMGLLFYAGVVSGLGLLALTVAPRGPRAPPVWWGRLGLDPDRWARLVDGGAGFRERSMEVLVLPRAILGAAAVWSLVHITARMAILPVLAWAALPTSTEVAPLLPDLALRPLFVHYATALLPPPGGAGGVEAAFAAVLGDTIDRSAVAATLVWWRAYTFYLPALAGMAVIGRATLSEEDP